MNVPSAAISPLVQRGSKNPGGRPVGGDPGSERSLKPWLMAGVSQRTYYRQKKAALDKPQQHGEHVTAWFRTLPSMARLDHRRVVRRALNEAKRAAQVPPSGADLLKAYRLLRRLH